MCQNRNVAPDAILADCDGIPTFLCFGLSEMELCGWDGPEHLEVSVHLVELIEELNGMVLAPIEPVSMMMSSSEE